MILKVNNNNNNNFIIIYYYNNKLNNLRKLIFSNIIKFNI